MIPANLSPPAEPRSSTDPRFRPGAYITDGADLYYVQRSAVALLPPSSPVLVVEDCMTTKTVELDYGRVDRLYTLVRPASDPDATDPGR